ncbi:MAG: hypothetical protein LBT49_04550 [Prevotellaceae bacterium]|jgi:uncharacterized protein (TIGR02145 family)|nr:hypothetical protein [Prevotellaceae bacterium]
MFAVIVLFFTVPCAAQDTLHTAADTLYCDEPGVEGSTFEDFTPCKTAPDASMWNLVDNRDGKRYRVKKLADGRYWMVQDLRFGSRCDKTTFMGSVYDQTGSLHGSGVYYGDCTNMMSTDTPINRGYLYDWAAAVNMPGAYYGNSSYRGCRGISTVPTGYQPGMCRGICPQGWHVPTVNEFTDAYAAFKRVYRCRGAACWDAQSVWEGVAGGHAAANGEVFYQDTLGLYWSSTAEDQYAAYGLWFVPYTRNAGETRSLKSSGRAVRCVRNY